MLAISCSLRNPNIQHEQIKGFGMNQRKMRKYYEYCVIFITSKHSKLSSIQLLKNCFTKSTISLNGMVKAIVDTVCTITDRATS
ncbi:Disease resistance protein TIR-NBS-LRR class family [Prunus dulcis]|uniref:Disease resistance protein TIR-NBS-LRR class family n=1 Tax=Prunus dulcis TaxID=3755 RepID=A0A4Y1QMH5_PRUDU|nr:Disease resistance protein TIR-NBS-LRR class family [Prunus dulcis]